MDEILRYRDDPDWLVEQARLQGMSDLEIVRMVCWGRTYADVRVLAKEWAPALGITMAEFVRMARPPKRKGSA